MTRTCVELFAGAGGASVGLHRAGFRSLLALEWDEDAHATLAAAGHSEEAVCGDVRNLELYSGLEGRVDLLWASPPCQAWSTAGKRLGAFDDRNGWPWTWDVVDRIQPRWVLCENVTGMLNHRADCPAVNSKVEALDADATALGMFGDDAQDTLPPPEECPGCYWERVVLVEARKRFPFVAWKVLNSADHGAPQRRERVILMAGQEPVPWPEETHSLAALYRDKWVTRTYWARHGVPEGTRLSPAEKSASQIGEARGRPWATVRDALTPLAEDVDEGLWVKEHQLRRTVEFRGTAEVAMNWDLPSDTVTCRRGGAKTNDALILDVDGRLRYLTVLEVAALQAFPPDHPWQGSKSAQYKQVGNAVPPPVAEALGRTVLAALG